MYINEKDVFSVIVKTLLLIEKRLDNKIYSNIVEFAEERSVVDSMSNYGIGINLQAQQQKNKIYGRDNIWAWLA